MELIQNASAQAVQSSTADSLNNCREIASQCNFISEKRTHFGSLLARNVMRILHFLYFDQRALNPDNAQTLLEAANYYQVSINVI